MFRDEAYRGIGRLHAVYADNATRRDWGAMRGIVVAGARFRFELPGGGGTVTLDGPDELAAFGERATAGFDFYSYEPLNAVLLEVGPTTATGRCYAHEVATLRDTGAWVEFYGEYADEYVLTEDGWRYAARDFRTRAVR